MKADCSLLLLPIGFLKTLIILYEEMYPVLHKKSKIELVVNNNKILFNLTNMNATIQKLLDGLFDFLLLLSGEEKPEDVNIAHIL